MNTERYKEMSKSKKKETNPQIEVRTFNWGPCVIKLKIQDDFKKVLLSEIKKSKEDYFSFSFFKGSGTDKYITNDSLPS